MSLSDDLARLHELHRAGALSDDEFATAKARNCEGFQLTLLRLHIDGRDLWVGKFSRSEQQLTVIASLE